MVQSLMQDKMNTLIINVNKLRQDGCGLKETIRRVSEPACGWLKAAELLFSSEDGEPVDHKNLKYYMIRKIYGKDNVKWGGDRGVDPAVWVRWRT